MRLKYGLNSNCIKREYDRWLTAENTGETEDAMKEGESDGSGDISETSE